MSFALLFQTSICVLESLLQLQPRFMELLGVLREPGTLTHRMLGGPKLRRIRIWSD